jgi:D-Tyr-tRNAtyr deacylase
MVYYRVIEISTNTAVVNNEVISQISRGLMVLVGIGTGLYPAHILLFDPALEQLNMASRQMTVLPM